MHEIQKALLGVIQERGLKTLPALRTLGEFTGRRLSAQQVKHHLQQLSKKGLISINEKTKEIEITKKVVNQAQKNSLFTLPMYGIVNCGPALSLVAEKPEGFMKISSSILKGYKSKNLFVVQASGDSMNKAVIGGKIIENKDFLVIDSSNKSIPGKGEIVLSVVDGAANIKRLYREDNLIVLISESTKDYPPIYIDPSDDFVLGGRVVSVMKQPRS